MDPAFWKICGNFRMLGLCECKDSAAPNRCVTGPKDPSLDGRPIIDIHHNQFLHGSLITIARRAKIHFPAFFARRVSRFGLLLGLFREA